MHSSARRVMSFVEKCILFPATHGSMARRWTVHGPIRCRVVSLASKTICCPLSWSNTTLLKWNCPANKATQVIHARQQRQHALPLVHRRKLHTTRPEDHQHVFQQSDFAVYRCKSNALCMALAMSDHNIFAILVPVDERGLARQAFASHHNASRYHAAAGRAEISTADRGRRDRSPTPTTVPDEDVHISFNDVDRIILSFDRPPKDPASGWILGADPRTSDVYLGPSSAGISHKHCRIWADHDHCVWLRDHSRHGTRVRLGETMFEERNNDTWILQYPPGPCPQPWSHITIMIRRLSFKAYFPNHNSPSEEYLTLLGRAHTLGLDAFPALSGLGIETQTSTAMVSGATTSQRHSQPLFFVLEVLSQNSQSKVTRVINVRDARVYVTKVFLSGYGQKRKRDHWHQSICEQIEIMKSMSHRNIIPVVEFWHDPTPTLVMPYYEQGTLHDYIRIITIDASIARDIFRQLLMGLSAIHSAGAVHRDLKPANVLLASVEPSLHLVIADFGLSCFEASGPMETYCGTLPYLAPEIGSTYGGYGAPVDMWALGVMMLEVSRPWFIEEYPKHAALNDWLDVILLELDDFAQDRDRWQEERLMVGMLQKEPEARFTAVECLEKGCESGLFRELRPGLFVDGDATIVNSPVLAMTDNSILTSETSGHIPASVAGHISASPTKGRGESFHIEAEQQMPQTHGTKKARL